LARLIEEAKKFAAGFAQFEPFAAELTEDFFAQHYPGEDLTQVGQNYEQLLNDLDQLIDLIARDLPRYSQDLKK